MSEPCKLSWIIESLDDEVDPGAAFTALFSDTDPAFWLDSSRRDPALARLSIFGTSDGAGQDVVNHRLGSSAEADASFFQDLRRRVRARTSTEAVPSALAATFAGGYVGYLGYEMKALTGGHRAHESSEPDAVWMWANRFVVIDHETCRTHIVAVCVTREEEAAAAEWVEHAVAVLRTLDPAWRPPAAPSFERAQIEAALEASEAEYTSAIAECDRLLRAGETYEICLTNRVRLPAVPDPLAFYLNQRERNPAPFAAFLRVGEMSVASSSPERFLRVDRDGTVECKPIKGTARRVPDPVADDEVAAALASDPKTRAENLMIVDLIRNDLSRVCLPGTVEVPVLMGVESYESVHQLVTTVRGQLKPSHDAMSCVAATFPPGSMTGAPKVRTMELIDGLEQSARGIYSGVLGYFALDGSADLSVVIRTAICTPDATVVGAGGAIVLDSTAAAEYEEMLTKAEAPLVAKLQARTAEVASHGV